MGNDLNPTLPPTPAISSWGGWYQGPIFCRYVSFITGILLTFSVMPLC